MKLSGGLWAIAAGTAMFGWSVAAVAAPGVTFGPVGAVESSATLTPWWGKIAGLASDGETWLAAYNLDRDGLFLRRVDANGKVVGDPILGVKTWARTFDIIHDGTSYLAAWEDGASVDHKWRVTRYASNGESLGDLDLFAGDNDWTNDVALARGEKSALIVRCGSICSTHVVTADGAVEGDILPGTQFVSASYSDGVWLVVRGTGTGLALVQLGADGTVIEGTAKEVTGPGYATVLGTPDGFGLALSQGNDVMLANVGFDGSFAPVPQTLSSSNGPLVAERLSSFGGHNYLFLQEWVGDTRRPLMQELSAGFVPIGSPVSNFPAVASYAVASSTAIFGLSLAADYTIHGATLHAENGLTADPLQLVGETPVNEWALLGAPAPNDGWLVAWMQTGSTASKIKFAHLNPNGARTDDTFEVDHQVSPLQQEYTPTELSRGPGGWLLSLSLFDGGNTPGIICFIADGGTSLSPVPQAANSGIADVVGSAEGWGRVVALPKDIQDNYSLVYERFNATRELVDRTTLVPKSRSSLTGFGTALRHGTYFVWWRAENGKVLSRTLPTGGPVGASNPEELVDPEGQSPYLAVSNDDWWAWTPTALYERGVTHQFAQRASAPSDFRAFNGASLAVYTGGLANGDGTFVPGSVALAEPTTELGPIAGAPSFLDAHFSEPAGQRALLLGFETGFFKNRYQRAVVSTVEVTGVEPPIETGGASGEGGGNAGGSELLAGAPANGGVAAVGDGGAATTPSDAGSGPSVAGSTTSGGSHGFAGNRPDDVVRGGEPSEGGDVTTPSDDPNGSRTSKGCGCRATGSSDNGAAAFPLLILGTLALRRRRIIPS